MRKSEAEELFGVALAWDMPQQTAGIQDVIVPRTETCEIHNECRKITQASAYIRE
ncbi:MAG TPA: hypothetical protein VKA94_05990 [Hyphomicrobiales bacterium]|nr:hypothetical protein [Hyphomicrobiales bacterium]